MASGVLDDENGNKTSSGPSGLSRTSIAASSVLGITGS